MYEWDIILNLKGGQDIKFTYASKVDDGEEYISSILYSLNPDKFVMLKTLNESINTFVKPSEIVACKAYRTYRIGK